MFSEILELGNKLERQGLLPPVSYYYYDKKEPIRWVLHIWAQEPGKFDLSREDINNKPRPFSGRTSGARAHLAADEAAYVFGKGAGSANKHRKFRLLLRSAEHYVRKTDADTAQAIRSVRIALVSRKIKEHSLWKDIKPKEWVSIHIEEFNQHLIDHPLIRRLWHRIIKRQCFGEDADMKSPREVVGWCSLTNRRRPLVHKISLKVKLWKPTPLHSINADAFVSGISERSDLAAMANIGQSFEGGDLVARTLNYLCLSPLHHKVIAKAIEVGKLNTDSPKNLFAFYWIDERDAAMQSLSVDPEDLLSKTSLLFGKGGDSGNETDDESEHEQKEKSQSKLPVDLSQLEALLNTPWSGQSSALRLDESSFCLLMLSPNTGRISVREWFKVGLGQLKGNLKSFLDAQRIEAPDGSAPRSFAIQDMLRALEESNISLRENKPLTELASPNVARSLLRCAYLGEAPPAELLEPAVICFRHPKVQRRHDKKSDRDRFALLQHQLAAVMKLILTHPKSELRMNEEERTSLEAKTPAFLSGSLLAVLEEAQLASMNWKINTTLIDQFYSTAATAPGSVLGMLISRITAQHMPKLRKNMRWKYDTLESLLESLQDAMDKQGGFPKILTLKQQAEFSLGFYTQRASFSRERLNKTPHQPAAHTTSEQGAIV